MKTKEELERLATELGDAAYTVPLALGPGLLESAYQTCLVHELRKRGFEVRCEVPFPVLHDGLALDAGYRVDLLLEDQIIVENKAVHATAPIHEAQLLTYLKLSGLKLGLPDQLERAAHQGQHPANGERALGRAYPWRAWCLRG